MTEPDAVVALSTLAIQLILPLLREAGEKVGEGAAGRVGEAIANSAGSGTRVLWRFVRDRLTRAGADAIADIEAAPGDRDAEAALRLQVRKELESDPVWGQELARLVGSARSDVSAPSLTATIRGRDNSLVQNVGDSNTVSIRARDARV